MAKSEKDEKGIIFLWNNKKSNCFSTFIKRKNLRRVMTNIADTPRQRKKLEKDTYWFNITDEGAAESNVAIIGMQKLFNGVIYESDGTIKEMEKNFFELIEKVWEVS